MMHTKAFLHADRTYDDSLEATLVTPEEWTFTFPYVWSMLRYFLNNITNIVVYAFRYIL